MGKKASRIFIACFILILLLPFAGMLLFGRSEAVGNEIASAGVSLFEPDGRFNFDILQDLSDYIADHFALRNQMITAWAKINAVLFKTSVNDDVVIGDDDWLYYADTVDDYLGRGMGQEELEAVVANLSSMQAYAQTRGVTFIFTTAPNKNSIYPENMPSTIKNGHENSNIVRLIPMMEQAGINYVDLYAALSEGDGLYYKTDTHWNGLGAAKAADELLATLGMDSGFSAGEFTDGNRHVGDLYEMLYPSGSYTEAERMPAEGFTFENLNNPNGGEAMRILTENVSCEGSLLCYRDSFGIALYPYLAESFGNAVFLRSSQYDLSLLDNGEYDVIIIEIVERNLPQLAVSGIWSPGNE